MFAAGDVNNVGILVFSAPCVLYGKCFDFVRKSIARKQVYKQYTNVGEIKCVLPVA